MIRTETSDSDVLGKLNQGDTPDHAGLEIPTGHRFSRDYLEYLLVQIQYYYDYRRETDKEMDGCFDGFKFNYPASFNSANGWSDLFRNTRPICNGISGRFRPEYSAIIQSRIYRRLNNTL